MLGDWIKETIRNFNPIDMQFGLSFGLLAIDSFNSVITIGALIILISSIIQKRIEIKKNKKERKQTTRENKKCSKNI